MYINTDRFGSSYFHLIYVEAQLKTKLWNEQIYQKREFGLILHTHFKNCKKLFWRFDAYSNVFRYTNNVQRIDIFTSFIPNI